MTEVSSKFKLSEARQMTLERLERFACIKNAKNASTVRIYGSETSNIFLKKASGQIPRLKVLTKGCQVVGKTSQMNEDHIRSSGTINASLQATLSFSLSL